MGQWGQPGCCCEEGVGVGSVAAYRKLIVGYDKEP